MAEYNSSFIQKFGESVLKYRYTQVPNLSTQNLKALEIKPFEYLILIYFMSYPEKSFHAASEIAEALNVHINTVRNNLYRMEDKRLIKPIHKLGEANQYRIDGYISKIQAFAILDQTSTQELENEPTQKIGMIDAQELGNNKDNNNNKKISGYQKFKEARKRFRKKKDEL